MLVPVSQSSSSQNSLPLVPATNLRVARKREKRQRVETGFKVDQPGPLSKRISEALVRHALLCLDMKSLMDLHSCSKEMKGLVNRFQQLIPAIRIHEKHLSEGIPRGWWKQLHVISLNSYGNILSVERERKELVPLIEHNKVTLKRFSFSGFGFDPSTASCISKISLAALGECARLEQINFGLFSEISVEEIKRFFDGVKLLREVVISYQLTNAHLNVISQNCSNLEEVCFYSSNKILSTEIVEFAKNAINIRRLKFIQIDNLSAKTIEAFKQNCPKLEYLEISQCKSSEENYLSHLPSSLVRFDLENSSFCSLSNLDNVPNLPNLRHLKVENSNFYGADLFSGIFKVCQSSPNIECLSLLHLNISEESIINAIKNLPLKCLAIREHENIIFSNTFIDLICKNRCFPELRVLILGFEKYNFTEKGLHDLSKAYPDLEYLSIGRSVENIKLADGFEVSQKSMREIFPKLKFVRTRLVDPVFPEVVLKEYGLTARAF